MWHVLHTAPHAESQVSTFLAAHGVESYAPQFPPPPRTRLGSVRAGRHHWVFPSYIFFRTPRDFTQWDRIGWAPGVRQVLQSDGSPAAIDEDVVDRLRRRLAISGMGRRSGSNFRPGQTVVVERGPLRMLDAIFERDLDAPARVQVLIELLGSSVRVALDSADLRATG